MPDTDSIKVLPFNFDTTLNLMLKNSIDDMGDFFWKYNAFTNNCITATRNLLGVNGMLSRRVDAFLKNPGQTIKENIPTFSQNIAEKTTDVARQLRTLVGAGFGFEDNRTYKYSS